MESANTHVKSAHRISSHSRFVSPSKRTSQVIESQMITTVVRPEPAVQSEGVSSPVHESFRVEDASLAKNYGNPARMLQRNQWLLNHPLASISETAYELIKRATDITTAILALVLLAPIGIFIAFIIWCEDQGPVFYTQERIGKNGKPFRFHKFRSMVCNADQIRARLESQNEAVGPIFKMKNDPRITMVGRVLRKYSLDEIPQFYNVLCGDMSLVGPRPHLPSEVARYQDDQHRRLCVQPGLICLREVCGRSRLTFDDWIALDLLYVKHRNLVLDAWILIKLIPAVLTADGAY